MATRSVSPPHTHTHTHTHTFMPLCFAGLFTARHQNERIQADAADSSCLWSGPGQGHDQAPADSDQRRLVLVSQGGGAWLA